MSRVMANTLDNKKRRRAVESVYVSAIVIFAFLTLYCFSGYILGFQGADASIYGEIARNIVENGSAESRFIWATWDTFSRTGGLPSTFGWKGAPLYICTVALFFKILGVSFWTMKLVSVTFGALLVVPTFFLTRGIFGRKRAVVAAFLVSLFPFMISNSIVPGDKVLAAFLVVSALCFSSPTMKIGNSLTGGLLSGLAFLARIDFGAMLFVAACLSHTFGDISRRATLKRRLLINGVYVFTFAVTILPWLVSNYLLFGFFLRITGVAASTLFNCSYFDVSPPMFFGAIGLVFVASVLASTSASHVLKLGRKLVSTSTEYIKVLIPATIVGLMVVFALKRDWLLVILSVFSTYPQIIYQSSPIIFVLAIVGVARSIRRIDLIHPILTFPVIVIISYTAMQGIRGLGAPYTIPYISIPLIFASSAVVDIADIMGGSPILRNAPRSGDGMLKRMHYSIVGVFTFRNLIATFFLGTILLSFIPQYEIILQSEDIHRGPFYNDNWNEAIDWVLANTNKNDTILARFPILTFYTERRSVALEPFNATQLLTIIRISHASYLVVDNVAYSESQTVSNSIIAWLRKYPNICDGFKLVYEADNPPLQIFDVREAGDSALTVTGWADENFTSGWITDSNLLFQSNGQSVEMACNNSASSVSFLHAKKEIVSQINTKEYPFLIIAYHFNYWTSAGYPPNGYLRLSLTDVAGREYVSPNMLYPLSSHDYDWHTYLWQIVDAMDIASLDLILRVGAETVISVTVDYVAFSAWPAFVGG